MKHPIYLDHAAATPLDIKVLAAMQPYLTGYFHNPSAVYLAGRAADQALKEARGQVARSLGAKPAEIVFTSGATESNNLAVQGVMGKFPEAQLLVSAIEHDSVLEPAKLFNHRLVVVNEAGMVDLEKIALCISEQTVLVSIMMVNNELGTLQPLREISNLVEVTRKKRQKSRNSLPLYLHTDAAQAGNYFDLHVSRLGVDMLTINGGKLYGPKQSGLLYIKSGMELVPLVLGGGQEQGRRSGTENLAGIVGFTKALELSQANHTQEIRRVRRLRNFFATEVQKNLTDAVINGSAKHQSPHILSVTFPGTDNERMVMELDEAGIEVGTGSACSAGSEEPSHVLSAIGLSDQQAHSTLRFSFGKSTTKKDLDETIKKLSGIAGYLR